MGSPLRPHIPWPGFSWGLMFPGGSSVLLQPGPSLTLGRRVAPALGSARPAQLPALWVTRGRAKLAGADQGERNQTKEWPEWASLHILWYMLHPRSRDHVSLFYSSDVDAQGLSPVPYCPPPWLESKFHHLPLQDNGQVTRLLCTSIPISESCGSTQEQSQETVWAQAI